MKQYNEQDVLKAIAGSYQPGFLQIKLTHSFDGGLARFSQNNSSLIFPVPKRPWQ